MVSRTLTLFPAVKLVPPSAISVFSVAVLETRFCTFRLLPAAVELVVAPAPFVKFSCLLPLFLASVGFVNLASLLTCGTRVVVSPAPSGIDGVGLMAGLGRVFNSSFRALLRNDPPDRELNWNN